MNATGRRHRQAKNRFNHLTPRQRPNYRIRDMASARRHEDNLRQRANQRAQNKAKK